MSLRLVCDKCENFCPNGEGKIIKAYEMRIVTHYQDGTQSSSRSEFHLCEKCYQDFIHFISLKEESK